MPGENSTRSSDTSLSPQKAQNAQKGWRFSITGYAADETLVAIGRSGTLDETSSRLRLIGETP